MTRSSATLLGSLLVAASLATTALNCGGGGVLSPGGAAGASGTAGVSPATAAGGSTAPAPDASVDAPGTNAATRPDGTCIVGAFPRNGVCTCQSDTPSVCGDACVDRATDPDQCGACAHACGPTSTCVVGVCGPAPVTVMSPTSTACGPIDLAVANGILYWTESESGNVISLNLASGVTTPIAAGEKAPTRVSVRGANVFWLDTTTRKIRQKIGAAAILDAVASATEIRGYVASPDGYPIYYSTEMEIDELDASGGAPVKVAAFGAFGQPVALALDGDKLVAAVDGSTFIDAVTLVPGEVASCDAVDMAGNGASVNCLRLAQGLGSLLVDVVLLVPGHAIWANGSTLEFSSTSAYDKMKITSADDSLSGIAVGGASIAFATTGDSSSPSPINGVIYEVSAALPDQVAVPIARGQLAPRALASDGKRVYWSTSDCAIHAIDL